MARVPSRTPFTRPKPAKRTAKVQAAIDSWEGRPKAPGLVLAHMSRGELRRRRRKRLDSARHQRRAITRYHLEDT